MFTIGQSGFQLLLAARWVSAHERGEFDTGKQVMSKTFAAIAVVGILIAGSTAVRGQTQFPAEMQQCLNDGQSATAAYVAEDWAALERFSRKALAGCGSLQTYPEERASDIRRLATALLKQRKFSEALAVADACLSEFYAAADCHVARAEALVALRRVADAEKAIATSRKLCEQGIAIAKRKASSGDDIQRRFYTIVVETYKVELHSLILLETDLKFPDLIR